MKRKHIVLCIIIMHLCASISAFPLKGYFHSTYLLGLMDFMFDGDGSYTITLDRNFDSNYEYKTGTYEIKTSGKIDFIILDERFPDDCTYSYVEEGVLQPTANAILFISGIETESRKNIYTQELYNSIYCIGYTKGFSENGLPCFDVMRGYEGTGRKYYDCSSYLVEKTKSYPVENLCNLNDATPWVEDAPGYGEGEGFTIKNSRNSTYPYLLLCNGYISSEKPYLYEQNGRLKKIRVQGVSSGKFKDFEILDTPHFQTIDISFIKEPEDLRITILEAYPGSKYEDTCVHYCITWDREVVPYR